MCLNALSESWLLPSSTKAGSIDSGPHHLRAGCSREPAPEGVTRLAAKHHADLLTQASYVDRLYRITAGRVFENLDLLADRAQHRDLLALNKECAVAVGLQSCRADDAGA